MKKITPFLAIILGLLCGYAAIEYTQGTIVTFNFKTITEKRFKQIKKGINIEKVKELLGTPRSIDTIPNDYCDVNWNYEMKLEKPITAKGGASFSSIPVNVCIKNKKVADFGRATL